jgi:menaquinol-cytochrome c reductase iron-sulfur subunit
VARLDSLPNDGTPQYFKVIADRWDAWNYIPNEPVGAVFLRKGEDGGVVAFNVGCPHAGCAVEFASRTREFQCPCHSSSFSIAGERSASSPSSRNLDELPIEIVDGDVWVEFMNYRTGTSEKIPVT